MHRTKDLRTAGDEVNITDFINQIASSHHISYTVVELGTATTMSMTVRSHENLRPGPKSISIISSSWFKPNAEVMLVHLWKPPSVLQLLILNFLGTAMTKGEVASKARPDSNAAIVIICLWSRRIFVRRKGSVLTKMMLYGVILLCGRRERS